MSKIDEMRSGFETAYIDGAVASGSTYRPRFVSNNYKKEKKFSHPQKMSFWHAIASRLAWLYHYGWHHSITSDTQRIGKRNIPGEILTTNYMNFSEPRALEKLHSLSNITLKMFDVERATEGFHTKGYIFKKMKYTAL